MAKRIEFTTGNWGDGVIHTIPEETIKNIVNAVKKS